MTSQVTYKDDPRFRENKYHCKSSHPVHFIFFKANISKQQEGNLKEYFEKELNCSIRVKREHGESIFMSSEQSNKKCKLYCFNNFDVFTKKFNIDDFEIDLT